MQTLARTLAFGAAAVGLLAAPLFVGTAANAVEIGAANTAEPEPVVPVTPPEAGTPSCGASHFTYDEDGNVESFIVIGDPGSTDGSAACVDADGVVHHQD